MKIIIPVSSSDAHRVLTQASVIRKMGPLGDHDLIYFSTPSAQYAAHAAAQVSDGIVTVMAQEPDTGWPIGPNQQFAAAVHWLGSIGNTSPFLWMEPDMLPRVPRWATLLENDYAIKGVAFLGTIVTFSTVVNGELKYSEGDHMMMGCGVYPPTMHSDERIRWAISNLGRPRNQQPRMGSTMLAFDTYLRNPMKQLGYGHTDLIADQWNTGGYRLTPQGIRCEALPFDHPHRKRGGLINPEAVLIHGCKDGSLEALLLGGEAPVAQIPEPEEQEEEKAPLLVRQEKAEEAVVAFLNAPVQKVEKVVPAAKAEKPAKDVMSQSDQELRFKILEVLENKSRAHFIGATAKKVGLHPSTLKKLLPKLGFYLTNRNSIRDAEDKPVKKAKDLDW